MADPLLQSRAILFAATMLVTGISYRGEHCQAAERAAADIEGHSEAAKFG